jgi:hypothetical protein
MADVKLANCTKDEYDYYVVVEYPNGKQITILIPTEEAEEWLGNPEEKDYVPFGLNLVTPGHYN